MKRYYNATTQEWYNEGQSLTKRVENGVFTGIPSSEQLTAWGFREWVWIIASVEIFIPTTNNGE